MKRTPLLMALALAAPLAAQTPDSVIGLLEHHYTAGRAHRW
jgi:hypothetical protein